MRKRPGGRLVRTSGQGSALGGAGGRPGAEPSRPDGPGRHLGAGGRHQFPPPPPPPWPLLAWLPPASAAAATSATATAAIMAPPRLPPRFAPSMVMRPSTMGSPPTGREAGTISFGISRLMMRNDGRAGSRSRRRMTSETVLALRAGPARAADAVHVVFRPRPRHARSPPRGGASVDVQAAGSHVGGHQHRAATGLENTGAGGMQHWPPLSTQATYRQYYGCTDG